jgi:catechol 2,3-dioxygenase-like lactoylglutathione lyase family enzyme
MLADRRVHATLPVATLEPSRAFWEGRLGLTPVLVQPTAVLYRVGEGSVFAISQSSGRASGATTQMAFTVPDIEAEVADLQGLGIVFEAYDFPGLRTDNGIANLGLNRAAWFKDPEGNLIGVVQLAEGDG